MAFYFCGENCSFYDSLIYPEDKIPENVVELKEEDYQDFLSKQANGYLILADEEGQPYAVKQGCGDCDCLQQVTFRGIFNEGDFNDFKKRGVYEINGETMDKFTNVPKKNDCVGVLEVYEVNNGEVVEQRFSGINSYRRFYLKTVDKWSTWVQFLSPEGGQISSDEIADNAITEDKIKDYAITRKKIAAYAVGKDEIEIEGIETQNLKPYCVTSEKIASYAVRNEHLATTSVSEDKIQDRAVSKEKIRENSILAKHILDKIISSEKLAEGLTISVIKINGANKGNNGTTYILLDNTTVLGDLDVKFDAFVRGKLNANEIELPLFSQTAELERKNPRIRANEVTGTGVGGMKIEVSFDEGETWYQLCAYINGQFTVGEG
jgi:hypothetical protein